MEFDFRDFWGLVISVVLTIGGALVKAANARIHDLELKNQTQDLAIASTKQVADALKEEIKNHSNDMKEIRDKVNQIENSITAVGTKVDSISDVLIEIRSAITNAQKTR